MDRILLSGCVDGAARFDVPEGLLETPVPPGWEGRNGLPTTVSVLALFCEHLSLGEFERGPVRLVLETHGKFNAPENCRRGDYSFLNILTRILVDDAEVAEALQSELGIPTSVAQIGQEPQGSPTAQSVRFAWTVAGQGESWMRIERTASELQEVERVYRLVWPAGERLGFIDLKLDAVQTQFEPTATVGSFASPMLIATTGLPLVLGIGVIDEEIFPEGQFRFFEGYECAHELDF